MARSRNIKPGFFTNDALSEVDPIGRLLFIGLWCIADREGRLQDRPRRIKAELLPYDNCDVDVLLEQLFTEGFIIRYSVDGEGYIQIVNFTKHQDPHYKEKASEIPAPDGHEDSGTTPGGVSEKVRRAIFKRDKFKCKMCGSKEKLTLDHIVPRSQGGGHEEENLQTLCKSCNASKGNKLSKGEFDKPSTNDRPMIDRSSTNHGSTLGLSSPGQSPLIPDSLNLIPDSLNLIPDSLKDHSSPDEPMMVEVDANRFMEFWSIYPKKVDKKKAEVAFKRIPKRDIDRVVEDVRIRSASHDWTKEGGKYIPNPTTYIHGERWNDQETAVKSVKDSFKESHESGAIAAARARLEAKNGIR